MSSDIVRTKCHFLTCLQQLFFNMLDRVDNWCDRCIIFIFFQKFMKKIKMSVFKISRDTVSLRTRDRNRTGDWGKNLLSNVGTGKELWSQNLDLKRIAYLRCQTGKCFWSKIWDLIFIDGTFLVDAWFYSLYLCKGLYLRFFKNADCISNIF